MINCSSKNMYKEVSCVRKYTWSVQKVSRILNFRGLRIFDFRFFVALCWYSYLSLMPTSSAIFKVQLIFNSYFAGTCFGSSSIFGQKQHNNVTATTVFPRFGPSVIFSLFPKLKRQKLKTSRNMSKQNSCQKLTERFK